MSEGKYAEDIDYVFMSGLTPLPNPPMGTSPQDWDGLFMGSTDDFFVGLSEGGLDGKSDGESEQDSKCNADARKDNTLRDPKKYYVTKTIYRGNKAIRFRFNRSDALGETSEGLRMQMGLFKYTCHNIGFSSDIMAEGLLLKGLQFSKRNERIVLRQMDFVSAARFIILKNLVIKYGISLDDWKYVFRHFLVHSRAGIDVDEEVPRKAIRFNQNMSLKTTEQVGRLYRKSLIRFGIKVSDTTEGNATLSSCSYPGGEIVQQARLSCLIRLENQNAYEFCVAQLYCDRKSDRLSFAVMAGRIIKDILDNVALQVCPRVESESSVLKKRKIDATISKSCCPCNAISSGSDSETSSEGVESPDETGSSTGETSSEDNAGEGDFSIDGLRLFPKEGVTTADVAKEINIVHDIAEHTTIDIATETATLNTDDQKHDQALVFIHEPEGPEVESSQAAPRLTSVTTRSIFAKEYSRTKEHLHEPAPLVFLHKTWLCVILLGAYLAVTEHFLFQLEESFLLLSTTVALLSLGYILLALVTPSCLDWAIFLFIIPFSAFLTSNQGPLLIYVSIQMLFWGRGGAFIWMHNGMGLGAVPLIVWVLPAEQNWLLIGQYIVMFIACHNKRINECSVPLTIALAFWRDLLSLLVVGFQLLTCQF